MDIKNYSFDIPAGQNIVSVIEFKDKLFVATDKHIFRLEQDGVLHPMIFKTCPKTENSASREV